MNSNFKYRFILLTFFMFSFLCFSQKNNKRNVTLIEKQNGKRLELFAKNEDSTSYVVFLRVSTDNYRRTSNRPVLTTVAPNSETHLLTLIKLAGKPNEYEKQFIVNEVSQNLSFRKDDDDFQINFDSALKTTKITIFESNNCEFCNEAKALFDKYKIAYNTKHVKKNSSELIALLKKSGKPYNNTASDIFDIQIKQDIYRNITNKEVLFNVLKQYIE